MRGKLPVLYVTAFVDMVGLTMIVPLLPFYATAFGASATARSAWAIAPACYVLHGWICPRRRYPSTRVSSSAMARSASSRARSRPSRSVLHKNCQL